MKNQFWYFDEWYGHKKSFSTLRDAVKSAKSETGNSITIFNSDGVVKIVDCHAPAPR